MNTTPSGYRYKQNRFQQLRGFCYAAASGSISKAAKRMYLSQPAVSQQIQSLESELSVTLFVRRGSRIELTHDGELLYEMASTLIEQFENLDEQFRFRRLEVDEGHIEVAAGTSTILYFLPRHVEAFHRAYPKIEVRLHNVTGLEGLEQLRTGLVDFAVGPLMSVPEDIEFHPIVSYEPVIITCLGHPLAYRPLSLKEISQYPLILPPRGLSTWNLVDAAFKKHGLSYQVAMEVGGWEVIKKYVEMDLGISLIISIGISGHEKLEVLPAGEFFPKRTYGVVLRKGKILTPQAKRFVSLLLQASELPVDEAWLGNGQKNGAKAV
ncbi:MAG TPA: LysR family transcriptional regulator [Verrucomicrobiae bacterium]|nr:LysR family transcriptional regulator [Verrucomicrobiae bacterium]